VGGKKNASEEGGKEGTEEGNLRFMGKERAEGAI